MVSALFSMNLKAGITEIVLPFDSMVSSPSVYDKIERIFVLTFETRDNKIQSVYDRIGRILLHFRQAAEERFERSTIELKNFMVPEDQLSVLEIQSIASGF